MNRYKEQIRSGTSDQSSAWGIDTILCNMTRRFLSFGAMCRIAYTIPNTTKASNVLAAGTLFHVSVVLPTSAGG